MNRNIVSPSLFLAVMLACAWGTGADAQNTLSLLGNNAVPGQSGVPMTVQVTNDVAFQGFSLSGTYQTGALDLTAVDFTGTIVEAVVGSPSVDFAQLTVDDAAGSFTLGVIFETEPTAFVEISPQASPVDLAHLLFDVSPTGTPAAYSVDLQNGMGTPPITNVLSSNGSSFPTTNTGGTLTVVNLYTLRVRSATVDPGDNVDILLELTNDEEVGGFTLALAYNSNLMTHIPLFSGDPNCNDLLPPQMTGPQFLCTDLAMALGGQAVETLIMEEVSNVAPNTALVSMGVVFDFCPPQQNHSLPPGSDQSIIRLRFSTNSSATNGTVVNLDLNNDFGFENLVVTQDSQGIPPLLIDGTLTFQTPVGGFVRGDTNADGSVGLADAILALNYLFVGGAAPTCFKSTDVNDSGILDLTDTIAALNYLFLGACPPPPPFGSCGDDPTPDTLTCDSFAACP